MRLEEYWGVGPKTAERLETELGVPAAVDAIEKRGRAGARRRRHLAAAPPASCGARTAARDGQLATDDTRAVYKELVSLAATYAVTRHAGDRIRVLTPLTDRAAMSETPRRRRGRPGDVARPRRRTPPGRPRRLRIARR